MDLFDLTGKVAIVTGSSRGIRRAIAEAFAEAGAKVVISSRNQEPCDEVAAAIRPHYGSLEALTDQVFERMMTNNVLSNLWLSTLVVSDMKAKRDGSIIFISSIGGF